MFKKIISVFCVVVLVGSLCACNSSSSFVSEVLEEDSVVTVYDSILSSVVDTSIDNPAALGDWVETSGSASINKTMYVRVDDVIRGVDAQNLVDDYNSNELTFSKFADLDDDNLEYAVVYYSVYYPDGYGVVTTSSSSLEDSTEEDITEEDITEEDNTEENTEENIIEVEVSEEDTESIVIYPSVSMTVDDSDGIPGIIVDNVEYKYIYTVYDITNYSVEDIVTVSTDEIYTECIAVFTTVSSLDSILFQFSYLNGTEKLTNYVLVE